MVYSSFMCRKASRKSLEVASLGGNSDNLPPVRSSRNDVEYSRISNTDGLFTIANLNSFLSPYEILLIAQENKYFGKFSYFIMKLYVVCSY